MPWLADILKNLTISKILVTAVFVTSVIMHFGPLFFPNSIPGLQAELVPFVFAAMVFTCCLLIFWGTAGFWRLAKTGIRNTRQVLAGSNPSKDELMLLFCMARDPTQPINLENIDYSRSSATKLEFHHWTKQLQDKGLARINPWDDNLVSLTDLGRKKALEYQKQVNRQ